MENKTHQIGEIIGSKTIKLSMIFSFKNEEDVLPELISRVRNVLKLEKDKGIVLSHELIFINDRSTDRSEEILIEQAKGHEDIKIINMSRTFGVSPCVMTGLKYSTGDAAIYMDADLQDPPEVISKILEVWKEGENVDVVNTVRAFRAGEPFINLQIIKLGYWILSKTSSIDLIPEAGDFKFLSRRAINHLNRLGEYNPYMRGMVAWVGLNQQKVYYNRETRFAGNTKFPIFSFKVINNFFSSALISFSSAPLHWASLIGLGGLGISTFVFLALILQKIFGLATADWLMIVTSIFFVGSIQLIGLGILGLYIQSVYIATKNRPNYIIESMFGFSDEEVRLENEKTV
jgi:polyisoprenyl-phosphate glycosyltransferase